MAGKIFIISAPSGAGKTTLVNTVLNRLSPVHVIKRVVTYTTKQPRKGEVDGQDYHFLSVSEFEQKIKHNFFLEWSIAYGAYYGSPRSILDKAAQGTSFLLIIDRRGAEQVAQCTDYASLIWVYTNNLEILRRRLQKRGTETSSQIASRLIQAQKEIELEQQNRLYKYHVLNDDFNDAVEHLEELIVAELGNQV